MKIAVFGDEDTVLAFRLAGMESRVACSSSELAGLLDQFRRGGFGLLLVTETLFDENRGLIESILLEPGGPLILEIPGSRGPTHPKVKASERIAALLRR